MDRQEECKGLLVTVIVPIYMIEDYVDRCITSIRNQVYPNLEVILIVDGSIDDSLEICKRHMMEDDRISVISQGNKGLSAARNEGIRQTHGEYVTFVDGDDWIEPEMIGRLVEAAEQNSAQICCCGHCREAEEFIQYFIPQEECLSAKSAVEEWLRNRNIKMMAWGKLYSRELFTENTFFPEGRCFEDTASCWQLFSRSQRVVVVPDCLYHYCIRDESISNAHSVSDIVDRWYAFQSLYNTVGGQCEEFRRLTVRMCFSCIEYAWHERLRYSKAEQSEMDETYKAMSEFTRIHIKECWKCGCNLLEWISAFCAYVQAPFWVFNIFYKLSRVIKISSIRSWHYLNQALL